MDKSLWPNLQSVKLPQNKNRVPVEKSSPSFAGALKKQTPSSTSASNTGVLESKDVESQTTEPKNTDGILQPDFEERKQAHKLRRQAIKQEKRLRREEDVRRQIVAPKGYRVQLVQGSVEAAPTPSLPPPTDLQEAAFPSLGSPLVARARTFTPSSRHEDFATKRLSARKREPITVDLHQMLVRSKKQAATRHLRKPHKVKKPEEILSGNPLDSSQPVRHRGKVREKPRPKKHSSVKKAILCYRLAKKTLKEQELNKESSDEVIAVKKLESLKLSENDSEVNLVETELCDNSVPDSEACSNTTVEVPIVSEEVESLTQKLMPSISATDVIHSRRFREYCDHMLSPHLDEAVRSLLRLLVSLQDRAYARDPAKAKIKKRMLTGLHEARKALVVKKVVLMVFAPDLEKCPQPGGLDDKMSELISLARGNDTPIAFALGRRKLGHTLIKKVPVSCVAVLSAEGAEEQFASVLSLLPGLRQAYNEACGNVVAPTIGETTSSPSQDVNKVVVSSLLNVLEQSLQTPKLPAFLQAIEAVEESD